MTFCNSSSLPRYLYEYLSPTSHAVTPESGSALSSVSESQHGVLAADTGLRLAASDTTFKFSTTKIDYHSR